MINKIKSLYNDLEQKAIAKANEKFNCLSHSAKRIAVVLFGVVGATICIAIMAGIFNSGGLKSLQAESILIPKTETPMERKQSSTALIPLGKMKGEVDGEFDSFYVAIDKDARIFINRNIKYNETAYEKSDAWKEISMSELRRYERDLHFIPLSNKSKGLKP